jgi:hypothetical protein
MDSNFSLDGLKTSLMSRFPGITIFSVDDVAGTTHIATSLDPVHANANTAESICSAAIEFGADSALVQGQGAYSMWICSSSGFSEEGSGYTD